MTTTLQSELVRGLFRRGQTVLLRGPHCTYAKLLGLDLGVCVANGLPWLDFDTTPGRVLMIDMFRADFGTGAAYLDGIAEGYHHLPTHGTDFFSPLEEVFTPGLQDKVLAAATAKAYDLVVLFVSDYVKGLVRLRDQVVAATGASVATVWNLKSHIGSAARGVRLTGGTTLCADTHVSVSYITQSGNDGFRVEAVTKDLGTIPSFTVWRDGLLFSKSFRRGSAHPKGTAKRPPPRLRNLFNDKVAGILPKAAL